MANSHPAAVIDSDAEVAADVRVGPFAVVMAGAKIGEGCEIGAHAIISSGVTMGKNNRIYPFAAVGGDAQDKKYQGESATLKIGDGNTVREFCTLNRGTREGGGGPSSVTTIGLWLMRTSPTIAKWGGGQFLRMESNWGGMSKSATAQFWGDYRRCINSAVLAQGRWWGGGRL